ncbi:thioredoxin family protein [Paenibacillus zeisoli]|uniref:Thioredoxin family protein n=1 Tax=Paenibacillus zeisoli TaxID=2496267 RepID=A0A433X4Q1_9BACL|nr:thioredoxin family protein [Paenibacillus zeisoli]RUT29034.1 thioredoxin family protein [Paenibacillus zeisoli]
MNKHNVSYKFRTGLTPQQFMEGMTKNKEAFESGYNQFEWPSEEDKEFFESLNYRDDIRVLILAADWCGDVVRNIPVVFRALEVSEWPVEVLILEENLDIMDNFLTMGGRSVPVVIFADTGGHVLGQWGPRPKHVQEVMIKFKQENPDREAPTYEENILQARKLMLEKYGEGNEVHAVIISELRDLVSGL